MPLTSLAQEPYAVLSDDNTVLTFYYDNQKEARGGMNVGPADSYDNPTSIQKVVFDPSFANCTSLTSTAKWFQLCFGLTTIEGIENLKTDNVTDMSNMFAFCQNLTNLDVRGFKTDKVTNMFGMFQGCLKLTNLDVSGFDTSNVTDMELMFDGCSNLKSLNVSGFNTKNVVDMAYMFNSCSNLISLDISNFVTSKTTGTYYMFDGCSKLRRIYCNDIWDVGNSDDMFRGCESLVGGNNTFYDESKVSGEYANPNEGGYFTKTTVDLPYTCFADGTLTFYYDNQENKRNGYPWVLSTTGFTETRWDGHQADVTAVVFDASFAGYNGIESTADWFSGFSNMTSITGLENLKTDNVTDMSRMFYNCSSLTSLNVSGFNTSNVTAMSSMFGDCSSLTSLDVSSFNTNNVTDMGAMFSGCSALTSFDVRGFKTDNVTDMSMMFFGCSSLTSLDVSGFNTTKVTDMVLMFSGCSNLKSLNVSGFNTANVTQMRGMFGGCSALTSLDVNGFNTANVTDMKSMFEGCSELRRIFCNSSWSASASESMFFGCYNLVGGYNTVYDESKITVACANPSASGYFTSTTTNLAYASFADGTLTFYFDKLEQARNGYPVALATEPYSENRWNGHCDDVTSIAFDASFASCTTIKNTANWFSKFNNLSEIVNLGNLKTENVTNMSNMFSYCPKLTALDVSGFNTSKVKNMCKMFAGCSSLTALDVSNFNTTSVTDMSSMFSGCSSLTALDVSNFNTTSVTDMNWMFYKCSSLTALDVSNFNTSSVTDMSWMFAECSSLTSLDVSKFNTESVTDMSRMFSLCQNLRRIYCNTSWNASTSDFMFYACMSLVSGNNTPYDDDKITVAYATPNAGGYFTSTTSNLAYASFKDGILTFYYDKQEQARNGYPVVLAANPYLKRWDGHRDDVTKVVFDVSFANCTNLTSTAFWFSDFINLEQIANLKNLKTDEVTRMENMFFNCAKLKRLDVSNFNTSNVEHMECMFSRCTNLKRIFCNDTWTATNSVDMFSGCDKLVGGRAYQLSVENDVSVASAHPGAGGYFTPTGTKLAYGVYDEGNLTFYYDIKEEERDGYPVCMASTEYSIYADKWDGHNEDITTVTFDGSFTDCTEITGTAGLFAGLFKLSKIVNLGNLKTDNVTTMKGMFARCDNLITLDLSKFNTSKVTNMEEMFADCSRLEKIYCNTAWSAEESKDMFFNCARLAGNDGAQYKDGNVSVDFAKPTEDGYFTRTLTAIDGKYWMTYFTYGQDIKADEHTKVYIGELNDAKDELTLHEITDGIIPPGQGVILMSDVEAPMLYLVEENSGAGDFSNNALRGSDNTIETSSVDGTVYTLAVEKDPKELGFFKYTGEKLLAHKAYLAIPSSQSAIRMVFGDSDYTGIKDTQRDAARTAERYFDLQGRPVANPTKGLYIVNGKKIVKK